MKKLLVGSLVVVCVAAGGSVIGYKKGVSAGMERFASLAELGNKHSHQLGVYEGEKRGIDEGARATEADYCGYAEMMAESSRDEVKRLHEVNVKYARSSSIVDAGDTEIENINGFIQQVAKEQCKHFTAEQVDKFVSAQKTQ